MTDNKMYIDRMDKITKSKKFRELLAKFKLLAETFTISKFEWTSNARYDECFSPVLATNIWIDKSEETWFSFKHFMYELCRDTFSSFITEKEKDTFQISNIIEAYMTIHIEPILADLLLIYETRYELLVKAYKNSDKGKQEFELFLSNYLKKILTLVVESTAEYVDISRLHEELDNVIVAHTMNK